MGAETAEGIEGAGILHVQSGTCALDIDDLSAARSWLAERGVDIDALLKAKNRVQISSGRPGRAKLLYRLKTPLRTIKPPGSGVELRCATVAGKSVHDALPPTIHPDTRKPYTWVYGEPLLGDWGILPAIPATLLAAWRGLLTELPPPKANGHSTEPIDIALQQLHQWINDQNPDMDYDSWLKVGMKLHHATGGAEEGLALWDGWSSKATRLDKRERPLYKGLSDLRPHWVSFSSRKGKVLATLDHELPSEADEFEIVALDKDAAAAEIKIRQEVRKQKKEAIKILEERLVFVVSSERYFDTERHRIIGSDSALEHMFTSLMPLRKHGRMNPVKILKSSVTKRLVEGLGFHPGEGALFKVDNDTFANNYRNRLPTPIEPTKFEVEKIEWMFERITDGNYRQWLKQYYAHVVQKPAVKIKSAPLIWSETQRNGKSTLIKHLPMLLVGREYSADVDHDLLKSPFNDYLQNAWHVNLAEFRAGTRGERTMISNKLRNYIADDMIPLHPKGGRGYTMPNHFFVTASSNDEDAAAIDNNDERWGVHEFKQPKFTAAERQWIYHEFLLTPRAAAVLRHYFLHIDLAGFDPAGSAPMTDSKREMATASMASDAELLHFMFEEQTEMFARDIVLTSEVVAYVHKHCPAKPSATRIGRILAKPPFNGIARRLRVETKFYRTIVIRNHFKWESTPHKDILAYIQGDNDDIDILA